MHMRASTLKTTTHGTEYKECCCGQWGTLTIYTRKHVMDSFFARNLVANGSAVLSTALQRSNVFVRLKPHSTEISLYFAVMPRNFTHPIDKYFCVITTFCVQSTAIGLLQFFFLLLLQHDVITCNASVAHD